MGFPAPAAQKRLKRSQNPDMACLGCTDVSERRRLAEVGDSPVEVAQARYSSSSVSRKASIEDAEYHGPRYR
jgi:hypothetical protein